MWHRGLILWSPLLEFRLCSRQYVISKVKVRCALCFCYFLLLPNKIPKYRSFVYGRRNFTDLKRIAFHLSFVIQLLVFHFGYLRCTGIEESTHLMFIHILLNQKRHGSLGVRTESFFLPSSWYNIARYQTSIKQTHKKTHFTKLIKSHIVFTLCSEISYFIHEIVKCIVSLYQPYSFHTQFALTQT